MSNFSFLQARDPSIINGLVETNKRKRNICCKKLLPLLDRTGTNSEVSIDDSGEAHYQVFLRLKTPPEKRLYTIQDEKTLLCHVPEGTQCTRTARTGDCIVKNFIFDKIFSAASEQTEIFHDCVKPQILNFINGTNATIMTYGASGSGKTYTIIGTSSHPGLIPRALEYLFRTLPSLDNIPAVKPFNCDEVRFLSQSIYNEEMDKVQLLLKNSRVGSEHSIHVKTYKAMQQRMSIEPVGFIPTGRGVIFSVWVSFLEIYNEQVFDLLRTNQDVSLKRPVLKILHDTSGKAYVKNLTCLNVSCGQEAYELLQLGKQNLKYASTSVNAHSSRSHCIFTIKLIQADSKGEHVRLSYFNFCDLAGSERAKDTRNKGDRLKESNNINTSLHVLGRCLKAVVNRQNKAQQKDTSQHIIPYRDSKLTQLFKYALSGHECVTMIVNINPSLEMYDTTQHVLNFSAVAKSIVLIPKEKQQPKRKSRFSTYLNRDSQSSVLNSIPESSTEELPTVLNDSEVITREQLQEIILFHQREMYDREQKIREEVSSAYNKLYVESNSRWEKLLQDKIEFLKISHQWDLDRLRTEYEANLDKSDDDLVEDFETNCIHLRNKLIEVTDLHALTLVNNAKLKKEIQVLTTELNDKTEVLHSAEDDYRTLELERDNLLVELRAAKTRIIELSEDIAELRLQLDDHLMLDNLEEMDSHLLKSDTELISNVNITLDTSKPLFEVTDECL